MEPSDLSAMPDTRLIALRKAIDDGLSGGISKRSLDEIWAEGEKRAKCKLDPGSSPG